MISNGHYHCCTEYKDNKFCYQEWLDNALPHPPIVYICNIKAFFISMEHLDD